jgi:hypothetical protein
MFKYTAGIYLDWTTSAVYRASISETDLPKRDTTLTSYFDSDLSFVFLLR